MNLEDRITALKKEIRVVLECPENHHFKQKPTFEKFMYPYSKKNIYVVPMCHFGPFDRPLCLIYEKNDLRPRDVFALTHIVDKLENPCKTLTYNDLFNDIYALTCLFETTLHKGHCVPDDRMDILEYAWNTVKSNSTRIE